MKKHGEVELLARAVCVDRGQLLVCHTRRARHTYLPGGHVEFGESAEQALCRELREETGLQATVMGFVGVVEHTFRQRGKRHYEMNLVFRARLAGARGGRPVASCEDWIDFRWIPLVGVAKSDLEPAVLRRALAQWLRSGGRTAGWASSL